MEHIEHSYIGMKRKEHDGSYFCIPATTQFPIFINKTMYKIFCYCEHHEPDYVIERLCDEYPEVQHSKVEKDVMETLWYFFNLGMITKPEKKYIELSCSRKLLDEFRILDEQDFYEAALFIKECIEKDEKMMHFPYEMEGMNKKLLKEEYQVSKIRLNHMMGNQRFYSLRSADNDKLLSLIGVSNCYFGKCIEIQSIFALHENDYCEVLGLLEGYCSVNGISRIKIRLVGSELKGEAYVALISCDYKKEATLKDEGKSGDVIVFSKKVENRG